MGTRHQKRKGAEAASGAPEGQPQGLADLADVAQHAHTRYLLGVPEQVADQLINNTLSGSTSCRCNLAHAVSILQ